MTRDMSSVIGAGLLVALTSLSACDNHCRDHAVGEYTCDGNTLVGCSMDDSGDLSVETDCGSKFCRGSLKKAICALRPDPEPGCVAGSGGWACDKAGEVVICAPGGYAWDVAGTCGAPDLCISGVEYNAFCALANAPDARCPPPGTEPPFICGGGHLLACQSGYVVKDTDCGGADLCYAPPKVGPVEEAMCVASAIPDPRCLALPAGQANDPRQKQGCDGTQIFYCLDNLVTELHECGAKGCVAGTGYAACNP